MAQANQWREPHDRKRRELPPPEVRVTIRPLASALPLGFMAFTVGIFVLSSFNLGWIPSSEHAQVALIVLAFVVPLETVCAIMAFLSRDTPGATGLGFFTGLWAALGIGLLSSAATSRTTGFFLLGVCVFILGLGAGSFQGKPLFGALLILATARFALMGVYQLTDDTHLETAGGIVGLVTVAFGVYAGIALLLEDVKQHAVLPLGRRGHDRAGFEDDLEDRLDTISREAGVRRHL